MVFRLSTFSTSDNDGIQYNTGDLSLYPELLDDPKSLYIVKNNAETKLKQSLTYNGKHIIVEDATAFPSSGIIRIGRKNQPEAFELVYYDKRNSNTFMDLVRGFAGSKQDVWQSTNTYVTNPVAAEVHNAVKDAVIKTEDNLGEINFPTKDSLNGILKALENRHLAPKSTFRGFPLSGPPGLKVRFQNFSNNQAIRFLWDFGDGTSSAERNPTHVYQTEGIYSVRLNMIMSTGAQGITIKSDYITVSNKELKPFFYVSRTSATNEAPATFEFVDQTDGDIATRYWVFDDGQSEQVNNPYKHTTSYTYTTPGNYSPSLLIVFKDQSLKRVFLQKGIEVI